MIDIYNVEGNKVQQERISLELQNFWKTIYQKRENNLAEIWNTAEKLKYEKAMTKINTRNEKIQNIKEHLDMITHYDQTTLDIYMHDTIITEKDIIEQLRKTKNKKAPGPNGIKADIYKILTGSDIAIQNLVQCLNNVLNSDYMPAGWKESKTILVPKTAKPTAQQFRPIALLNTSYKLFMGIIKNKIEQHMKNEDKVNEMQSGFTKARRVTDNLFILSYCIEESFKMKTPLYVIAIDFAKAFDSVNREQLIRALMSYKIN